MKKILTIVLFALLAIQNTQTAQMNVVAEQQEEERKLSAEEQAAFDRMRSLFNLKKSQVEKEHNLKEIANLLRQFPNIINTKMDYGRTALMDASIEGDLDLVKLLIEHGADLNAQEKSGTTALLYASGGRNSKLIELLAAHGAEAGTMNLRKQDMPAYKAGRKQWQRYLDEVARARKELEELVTRDPANIITGYVYEGPKYLPKEQCVVQ